jgi:hypothetical protein
MKITPAVSSVQFSVGDSHRRFVVEEEIEVYL